VSLFPDFVEEILICPKCHDTLIKNSKGNFFCQTCSEVYPTTESGSLDLRLKSEKSVTSEVVLGKPLHLPAHFPSSSLAVNATPQNKFTGINPPHHFSKELLSYFPKALSDHSMALDLGCGDTVHRDVCESAGFRYVGLDYSNKKAPLLGDGHALPFRDNCFEFVLMIAVLEHIQYPLVLMQEVNRVLKVGGILIGTVSFLEPFHENSFYHHTHLGLYNDLVHAGFKVDQLAASKDWQVFDAQANMAPWVFFPGLPNFLRKSIIRVPKALSRLWFNSNRLFRKSPFPENSSQVTGAFSYVARKPEPGDK
jgi:SAM-dependent methyltransferase